jgi:two-component system, sensor histidine kinase YesM
LILFMTAMVIAISLFNLYFYNKAYSSMDEYNNLLKEYSEVNNLSIKLIQGRDSMSNYVDPGSGSANDKSHLKKYNEYTDQVNKLIREISKTSNSQDTYLLTNAIQNSLETYEDKIDKVVSMEPGTEETYLQFLNAKNYSFYIESYIKQLLDIKLSEGEWYHQQLTNRVKTIRVINFISVFVIMIFSLIFIVALSNSITVPIKKLTQFARNISHGDFKSKELELNSSDDINILASSLNQMSNNIENMIRIERQFHDEEIKSIRISKELNEAKFLALQSQINPHFLFNTLNAIARFTMFEGAKKSTKLIESLSSIFRYNLKSTEEVSLNEELNTIKEYASIQNARFGEKFELEIICRADISNVRVPRFIIQPLVENAVIHGLEPKESGGKIRIKIYEKTGILVIKVIDNGKGISKELLKQLLDSSDETTRIKGHTTGIGLNNVRDRLLLYYKNSDCFKLKSEENIGTVITLNIRRN